jgi:hypothetical protein
MNSDPTPQRVLTIDIFFFTLYFIMILLSIYIYNWIGNKFLQLTSPSPYKYINSINKTNQMTPISIEYILFGCNVISEELNTLLFKSVQKFIRQTCRFNNYYPQP